MSWVTTSNLYVAVCAASLVWGTRAALGLPLWPVSALVLLVFFATLLVYGLDRLAPGAGEDALRVVDGATRGERVPRAEGRMRRVLVVTTALGAVGCAVSALWLPWHIFWAFAPPGVLAIGYSVALLPWRGRVVRLKDVPGLKIFLVALVWSVATVSLPAWELGEAPWRGEALGEGVLRAGFIFAITLPFDVRDMARDRRAGVVTLPHHLGVAGTRRLALGVMGAVMGGALLLYGESAVAGAHLTSGALTCGALLGLRAERGWAYYALLLDGLMLAHAALLIAARVGAV